MHRRYVAGLVALTLAGTPGCFSSKTRVKAETAAAKLLIPRAQEEQLGRQVKSELETKQNVKYLENPEVVAYVRSVSSRITRMAAKDRSDVSWKVNVIDDPKTVNAFATPGGYLYVYTGLILAADNEAELAGVMAHEAGHVVGRHSARAMVNQYGLQAVTAMALGKNAGALSQAAAGLAGNGVMLAHGRSEETEADEYGARYTSAIGYDPRGLITFFQKLAKQEGNTPTALKWLSTHPTSQDRVSHLTTFIAQKRLSGNDVGADRLTAIKAKLR